MAETKLCSLNELFNTKFFRIPDFQRGYSWGDVQLEDFWSDLENLKDRKSHYTGLLTIEPIYKNNIEPTENWKDDLWLFEKGFNAYYLIDGQQRLTTSIILINEILNTVDSDIFFNTKEYWTKKFLYESYKGDYKSYIFGYEKDNPSDEFFKTRILQQESSSSDKVPESTLYTMNLDNAKKFFEKKLSKLNHDEIENLFKKLISSFKFNLYEIDDELNVHVTFETMNNRGKKLSTLELLKNRLVYLTTLFDDEMEGNRLRKDINESWKTIYEYLGKNKDKVLSDDEFLRDHWIMYFTYNRKESSSYAKFLLNDYFISYNVLKDKVNLDDIKSYIKNLQVSVKSWFYLHNPEYSSLSNSIKEWLCKLNRLKMRSFTPLLIAVMNKYTESKCIEKEFLSMLKVVERFIFLIFMVSQRRSDLQNSVIYRYANEFHNNKKTIQEVIKDISYLIDGEGGEGDDYYYDGWLDINKFISYLDDKKRKEEGFYSWNGLRYFLYEYELELQQKARGKEKISWNDFEKRNKDETIEHVYPQTANDKYWKEHILKYVKKQNERFMLLHSLGNLVLLSRSKNSELQNKDFDFKKSHEDKDGNRVGFFNGSYSEIEISNYNEWNASVILERGIKMLEFMESRWGIDFNEWEVKPIDILGLGFLDKK